LPQAQARAAEEGLSIALDVGDAESMPYEAGQFDAVVTMFGAMFAARPERAASELLRVTRSGGTIAMANWTPTGFIGEMFKATTRFVPPPPGASSPLQWGTEEHVRARLGPGSHSIKFCKRLITLEYPVGPAGVVNLFRLWYGPTLRAFASLGANDQADLQAALETLWRDHNRADDGTTRVQSEYLEVIAVVKY